MQVLVHDDIRIDTRIEGSGSDAMVLLHGFPLTREVWNPFVPALSRTHRTIVPNLRGVGESSVVGGPYLMDALAGDLAAVLDHLGVERATIVGHSLGGYVALAFARMYEARVAKLALVCSRITADDETRARSRNELADRIERAGSIEEILRDAIPPLFSEKNEARHPEMLDKIRKIASSNDARALAALLRGMALRDGAEDLAPELDMPVLVIAGAEDRVVPPAESEAMARAFPKGRLEVIEGAGHLPMVEAPERLAALLGTL